jgi:beta-mannosidase
MIVKRRLTDSWTLACISKPGTAPPLPDTVAATVPGTVHTDLLAARLIPDPYLDVNEIALDWIGRSAWRYATAFDWSDNDHAHHELVFEGLDTVADIRLNGQPVGRARNMHRSYRFDVAPLLKSGTNHLEVDFLPVEDYGAEVRAALGSAADIPANYPGAWPFVRKMACNFGWDWGPTLVTAGIWKPVVLESWSTARLGEIRPQVTLAGGLGHVVADVGITGSEDKLFLTLSVAEKTATVALDPGACHALLTVDVNDPKIWWPHGLGDQPLYDLEIVLTDAAGTVLDRWTRKTGFRSVRLDTSADEHGSAFTIVVNDVPVFVRGANWIPDDCFLPRVTRERYAARVAQARDANINLLRVWGGGIYETQDFYETCDAQGLLVWQDFLFACSAYPEGEPVRGEVEAEARENVARLMPHPSLILWNGNNENIWGYFDWGWQDVLGNRPWGAGYYLDLLPKIVLELDPSRPYWAGSPYSGSMDLAPNLPDHGCMHIWDVWNEVGYETYRDYIPRFCSEFGWQAPPALATIRESVRDNTPAAASPGVLHHQKATLGNDKLLRGLAGWFPEPRTFEDWHFVTQLNQARAIRLGIEHMRSHRPVTMGAIVWQLNDCWPVTSWAAIDGAGRRKPLWYALRAAYAPHLLTIQPRDGTLKAIAVNDTALFWRVPFSIERLDAEGRVLASHKVWRVLCDRFERTEITLPPEIVTPGDPAREFLRARMGESEALWFFAKDIEFAYPEPAFEHRVESLADRVRVTITAKALLRDLTILADSLHPRAGIDDMLVTLLPGETKTFEITFAGSPVPAGFRFDPAAVRTANAVARTGG